MDDEVPPEFELPEFDLYGFTPYRLAVAAKRTSEELARLYRARFGITIPEWRVLVHLARREAVSAILHVAMCRPRPAPAPVISARLLASRPWLVIAMLLGVLFGGGNSFVRGG